MAVIVDLTDLASVYATRLLVEAGHAVTRVEPRDGDELRHLPPHLGPPSAHSLETGAYHGFYNAGKRSLALDLARDGAREVLTRLIARADAVIASGRVPIDLETIRAADPRLVTIRVDDDAPELCAYARSGLLSITGHPGEEPMILGAHITYAATGLYAGLAATAALWSARSSGVGRAVTVSVLGCLESWMEQPMVTYLTTGAVTERRGFRGAITAVSGAFRCRDGYWMVSVPHGAEGWERFIGWIQDPVLAGDLTLADERERLKKRDAVLDRISAWSKDKARDEIVAEAQRRRVPASPVTTPLDLVGDPQLVARGFQRPLEHPLFGGVMFPQGAIATVTGVRVGAAPILGQHNAAILTELGYSESDRRDLVESGAV